MMDRLLKSERSCHRRPAAPPRRFPARAHGNARLHEPRAGPGRSRALGPRSDVYSLGATLYSLLTGKPPFEGNDLGAVLRAVQKGEFPPPRPRPDDRPALEAVCLKAMALKPEDRYASPRALADDVERWTADEPVAAYPETLRMRLGRGRAAIVPGCRRGRRRWLSFW